MSDDQRLSEQPGIFWLASYPKSGNTWFRAFLSNLRANGTAPVDINEMRTGSIASARGWLDDVCGFDTADLCDDEIDQLRPHVYKWALQSPECLYAKIHDAYSFCKDGTPLVSREGTLGAIYIIRNPLDVVSSAAAHWGKSLDDTIKAMSNPKMAVAATKQRPAEQVRQKLFTWSQHVLSWVDAPGLRCQVLRYEDMLASPMETFSQAARFLKLPEDVARVEKAVRFSDFKVLSAQEAEKGFRERSKHSERFFRQGKSGAWQDKLSTGQIDRIIEDHHVVMRRFGYLSDDGRPI